jgi:hypothetical protein
MAQAEHVRNEAETHEMRVSRRIVQIGSPPGNVEDRYESVESGQAAPFGRRKNDVAVGTDVQNLRPGSDVT